MAQAEKQKTKQKKKKKKKKKRAISSDDISRMFKCWAFAKNPSRGQCHATGLAVVEPRHKGLLAWSRWKADRDRRRSTSRQSAILNLSCNNAAQRHRDGSSTVDQGGEFRNGACSVWLEDDKSTNFKALPNDKLVTLDISRT